MIVKPNFVDEFKEIYCLVTDAFSSVNYFKKGDESKKVKEFRESSDFIPELSLVVEEDNKLIAYNILLNLICIQ